MPTIKQSPKNTGLKNCLLFFVAAICILGFSSNVSSGAMTGLKISSSVIIPSLFPFTVCSVFFQKSGGLLWLGNKLNKITTKLLKITGTEISVIFLSLMGGYPIGAKIADELYLNGDLDLFSAKKLLRFSVNPSPAFYISVVGIHIFKSFSVGVILFISNLLACFTLNCLFLNKNNFTTLKKYAIKGENFSDCFVASVISGAEITINICSFIILFSAIIEIVKLLPIKFETCCFISPLLEISFGINEISKLGVPTYLYSFFLSFGGLSTICQVKQSAKNIKPTFLYLFFYRFIHSIFSTLITMMLLKIFPIHSEVFSNGTEIKFTEYPLFIPSVMLIIFSAMFLFVLSSPKQKI